MRANDSLGACVLLVLGVLACGDDDDDTSVFDSGVKAVAAEVEMPPLGGEELQDWLESGVYLEWACEPESHAARPPSPHGWNRVCSNTAISADAEGSDAWPEGAASVKELFESEDASEPMGHAVSVKTAADSGDGANWYWYETIGGQVTVDGAGDQEGPMELCVSCHIAAGSDAEHTPTLGGRDLVYTPVPAP